MMPFWIALQFLTILPVQLDRMPTAEENARAVLFYPVVGLLLGGLLYALALLLVPVPTILTAVLITVFWIGLTGGLHLDGLADTADAWVGGFGDKTRTLEIMKDPACGPIGVISLIALVVVKVCCVYLLLMQSQTLFLIFVLALSRTVPILLFLSTPYVRKKGLGRDIAARIPRLYAYLISISIALGGINWGLRGMLAVLVSIATIIFLRRCFIKRIDGITGDTIGASIEIVEAMLILSFVLLGYYLL